MAYYTGTTYAGKPVNDGSKAYKDYVASGKTVVDSHYVESSNKQSSGSKSSSKGVNSKMINVYGAPRDLAVAKNILGSGYRFIDTSNFSLEQQKSIEAGAVVLGGTKAGGGVSVENESWVRLAGYDVSETAQKIMQFATGGIVKSGQAAPVVKQQQPLPSSSQFVSPSLNPSGAIQQAGQVAGSGSDITGVGSFMSGMNLDKLVGVFVGLMFVNAVFSLVARR